MKRLWIGIVLLLVLLSLGIYITVSANGFHNRLASQLEDASQTASAGNWAQAQTITHDALGQWKNHWRGSAAIIDHGPMEEIDCLFVQLEVYLLDRELTSFRACCACLCSMIRAAGEAQSANWWNLL